MDGLPDKCVESRGYEVVPWGSVVYSWQTVMHIS